MKRKNTRKGFGIILKSLVAAVLVTSIVVSTLFGSLGAEFVKSRVRFKNISRSQAAWLVDSLEKVCR